MTEEQIIFALGDPDLTTRAGALGTLIGLMLAERLARLPDGVEPGSLICSAWQIETLGHGWKTLRDSESEWRASGYSEEEAGAARHIGAVAIAAQLRIANITATAGGVPN